MSLYIVSNAIPISTFIGGAGFITAGIIILPIVARLLNPKEAILAAIIAPLALFFFQLSIIPIYGFYGMLIPSSAILIGSLGFNKSDLFPIAYTLFGAIFYLLYSNGTILWLLPYVISILLSLANYFRPFKLGEKKEVITHSLQVTICELTTMTIGSITLLNLKGEIWSVILPFMLYERSVAVISSTIITLSLIRVRSRIIG